MRHDGGGEDRWTLEDLNSTNGTRRNGPRITEIVTLQDGDELTLRRAQGHLPGSFPGAAPASASAGSASTIAENVPPPTPAAPRIEPLLAGVYRLETLLGEGPGYKNYRAQDTKLQLPAAVKLIDAAVAAPRAPATV